MLKKNLDELIGKTVELKKIYLSKFCFLGGSSEKHAKNWYVLLQILAPKGC